MNKSDYNNKNIDLIKKNLNTLINQNKLDLAMEILDQYKRIINDDVDTYSIEAIILMMEGKFDKAEQILKDGLKYHQDSFDLVYNMAYLYKCKGDIQQAINYYNIALNNTNNSVHIDEINEELKSIELQGNGQVQNGSTSEDNFHVNEFHSNEMESFKEKFKENIQSFIEQGFLDEAKKLINEYESIVESDVDVITMNGVIHMMQGSFVDAEGEFLKALDIQPQNKDILYNLAYLSEKQEKYITAYRYYIKLRNIDNKLMDNEITVKINELGQNDKVRKYINRKKVLFIAHIFPPVGGSGVQRSLKFVKYLREFGWEPIVITVGKTSYPLKDETMISEIPDEIEVIRIDEATNIDTVYANRLINIYSNVIKDNELIKEYIEEINKSKELLNQLLLMPDPYILWATEVLDKLEDKISLTDIDMIYTTSGPYSDHIIGYILKQKYNKSWVVDFRDEWTNNPYVKYDKTSIKYKIDYSMEKNILNYADKIITVTPISKQNYEKIFHVASSKIRVITNGYDENDFIELDYKNKRNDKFTITHNGLLYMIRTPETFLKAIKNLISTNRIDKEKIIILFPWMENEKYWREFIEDNKLNDVVKVTGYMSHQESIELANASDLLLLIVGRGKENKAVYTGKIFEYLRLCKPIIALSPKESIVEKLLEDTKRGKNFEFDNIKGIEEYIHKRYKYWEEKSTKKLMITEGVLKFERKNLTNVLGDLFDEQFSQEQDKKSNDIKMTYKVIKGY